MKLLIFNNSFPIVVATILIFCGCNNRSSLDNFDSKVWKSDAGGCEGKRKEIAEKFPGFREKLKGKSNKEILNILGKPDKNELYRRSQKFFIYYLTPSEECENGSEIATYMQVRFSALGQSNEVLIITPQK